MTLLNRFGQKIAEFFGETSGLDHQVGSSAPSSELLDPDYLSDLLHYRLYDSEKKIYENKTSCGFVLEVVPLNMLTEDAQKELSALFRDLGEEGASIQCLLLADYRIDRLLNLWQTPRGQKGGIYQTLAQKKQDFFLKEAISAEVPPRVFRFFLSYSQPKPLGKNTLLYFDHLLEKKKKALAVLSRLSIAMDVDPLSLLELLSGMVNFDMEKGTNNRQAWNPMTWISRQVCQPGSAISIQHDNLIFQTPKDSAHFKTYEAVDFPDQWNGYYMGELIGDFLNKSYRIPTPFYLHYGVHFPVQQTLEAKLKGKSKIIEHQIKFPSLVRMFPDMPREREEHLLVQRQLLEGEKLIETRFNCGLWAPPHQMIDSESKLVALFQKYGFKLKENHFVHFPDFLSSLPMAWGEDSSAIKGIRRTRCLRTSLTTETGSLIPIVGECWGNSVQGMLLMGRRGQISTWDSFATEGNLNTVVIGPSGSGKSVFMQEMITTHLGQGSRVFVLDLGRSFERLCYLLGGQYLAFSHKNQYNLNPFASIKSDGDSESLNAALSMASSTIATMAMPFYKIDKERADIINSRVKLAWQQKGNEARIDDVIHSMKNMRFNSELMIGAVESLEEGLQRFTTQGDYAHYFYGSQPINMHSDLVVIETEELKGLPDLQTVILQIFTLAISNQIFLGGRERRCVICIDEAWDLLKSPQMEGFIESLARRLRKYNGCLVVGTQSLKDFDRTPGARAAFQNSNWLVMLGKDDDAVNVLKKEGLITMDSIKESALSSLRMEPGKYSELFLYNKGTGYFSVKQLKLDPFSSLLYSTKAEDFQAVQELQKHNKTVEEAVGWLLEHRAGYKALLSNGVSVQAAIKRLLSLGGTHAATL